MRNSLIKIMGEENYIEMENPIMGGEDFAYFAQKVPSAFAFVGVVPNREEAYPNHHPKFNFKSEMAVENAKILTQTVFEAIENYKK